LLNFYEYLKLKSKCVDYYYNNNYLNKEKDVPYWGGFGDNQVPYNNTYFSYGDILFETIPVPRTLFGACIIIGAGVYIYFREKVRGQMIATDTPPNK